MAKKKKKVVVAGENTCPHCLVEFQFKVRWCPHCEDHHHIDDMRGPRGWCGRCEDGGNEEYLARRRNPPPPAVVKPGTNEVIDAYTRWVSSPEYKHRFEPEVAKKSEVLSDKEKEALEHQAWIDKHFAGL